MIVKVTGGVLRANDLRRLPWLLLIVLAAQACASNERRATPDADTDTSVFPDVDIDPLPVGDCKNNPTCQMQAAECAWATKEAACTEAGSACMWCASAKECWIAGEFCPSCEALTEAVCDQHRGCLYCDRPPGPGCVNISEAGSCQCWQAESEGNCKGACDWCPSANVCIPDEAECVSRRLAFVAGPIKIGTGNDFTSYPPTFSGLAGADSFCNYTANSTNITGRNPFKAWLSSSTASVKERFVTYEVPYIGTDSQKVSQGWTALTSGGSLWSSLKDVYGGPPSSTDTACTTYPTTHRVWTGTKANGTSASENCNGWTSTQGGSAVVGGATEAFEWTDKCVDTSACGKTGLLYCFEQ